MIVRAAMIGAKDLLAEFALKWEEVLLRAVLGAAMATEIFKLHLFLFIKF